MGTKLPLKIPAAWYPSPINLPERKAGKVYVKHRYALDKTPIIGLRQAFARGIQPASAMLKEPLRYHELSDKNGVWMTDLPEELFQIEEALAMIKPSGRVLVAGLGLGIMAKRCAQIAKHVTVVEINKQIIKLCAAPFYKTVRADIFDYLNQHDIDPAFSHYILDTWRGTGETTWWEEVLPLRRLIRNIHGAKPKIHCWAEDIMQGQVSVNLLGPHRHWHYTEFPPSMSKKEVAWFFKNIGLPEWEKRYGHMIPRKGRELP